MTIYQDVVTEYMYTYHTVYLSHWSSYTMISEYTFR